MNILHGFSHNKAEIKPELAAVIEGSIRYENTAYRNAGKKLLNRIYKEIN